MKQVISIIISAVLLVTFIAPTVLAEEAADGPSGDNAEANFDEQFNSDNDILFYDPRCSSVGSSSESIVIGETNTKTIEAFVDAYGQMAFDTGKKYGIPYEAILAQGALESSYGNSGLTKKANNFFGIKAGSKWTGETINLQTGEEGPGGSYTTNAAFRKYPSPAAGWDGYGEFITGNQRYSAALKHPGDPEAYIAAIKAAGYATDSQYVAKNVGLINKIKAYVASTGKWPPSSEVAKTNTPTGGSGTTDNTSTAGCTSMSGGGSGTIAQTALNLAWPNRGKHQGTSKSLAKQEYQVAMPQFNNFENAGQTPWTDCGVFVATVMKASGADPEYPGRGTGTQLPYVKSSPKYDAQVISDTSLLKPGDVMVLNGHTYVYTGPYKGDDGKDYSIAQASLGGHPPEAGIVYLSDRRGPYTTARLK